MKLKSVRDADVSGKRVLVRVDFNVPLDQSSGQATIKDDTRIKAALPTIKLLQEKGAGQILLLTHLGRPEGTVVEELRTAPIAAKLDELGITGVEMLENVRFNPGDETNDPVFAQELAQQADLFVNDAFATAHRMHASTVGVAKLLPSYAGLLMEREVEKLSEALTPPQGALAIIGGAKFETKQPLIEKLLLHYDAVLVGGAIANDVLKARGIDVGMSLVSPEPIPQELADDARVVAPSDTVESTGRNVDIGAGTASSWADKIAKASFVLWNGPLGIYEEGFVQGTDAVAQALATSQARAVVGGGDTIAAVSKFTFAPEKIFISTGGGAMLQFLAEGTLPALVPLEK